MASSLVPLATPEAFVIQCSRGGRPLTSSLWFIPSFVAIFLDLQYVL